MTHQDTDVIHIYVGTDPEPEQRLQLDITRKDYEQLPRGQRARATVTDVNTGKRYVLRRASCGLPNCMCALALVKAL